MFQNRTRKLLQDWAIVTSLCAILVLVDLFTGLESAVTDYIKSPFYYILDMPRRIVYDVTVNFLSKQDLVSQNERLKAKIIELGAQQSSVATQLKENEILRELLSSSGRVKAEFTHAEIIALANDLTKKVVIINKGTKDDVKIGQALVDSSGVFGHVTRVSYYTSQVLLVTDKDSYVPVQNDLGLRAIVAGSNNHNELELINQTNTSKFKVGDKLYTSGLALRYMPGYPVGVIESISNVDSLDFVKVKVRPYAHLDSSRQLLLVWLPENKIVKEARENYAAVSNN